MYNFLFSNTILSLSEIFFFLTTFSPFTKQQIEDAIEGQMVNKEKHLTKTTTTSKQTEKIFVTTHHFHSAQHLIFKEDGKSILGFCLNS